MNATKNTIEKTPCYFHIGRGGRFYNAGHKTFVDFITIEEVCRKQDDKLFYTNRDLSGRFCKPFLADCNGNHMIDCSDLKTGVGQLDWDGYYDTDIVCALEDCSEEEHQLIYEYNGYKPYGVDEYIETKYPEWITRDVDA